MKGWFTTPERLGDRTLAQQMNGLTQLFDWVPGKSVLDVGCAEGLISTALADVGASAVHGIEVVPGHIEVANKLRGDRACTFEVADANLYVPVRKYDFVLMLGVLHKLRDPSSAAARFATAARELAVVRLPPEHAPLILDDRSGNKPHNIDRAMEHAGFRLVGVTAGHLNEWVGYYKGPTNG